MRATVAVTRLNSTCADAARFAHAVAPIAAIIAVTDDPIFAPTTAAAASVRGSAVVLASVRIAAVDALDDCMMSVSTSPQTKNPSTERNPYPLIAAKSIIESTHVSDAWRKLIPRKSIPNPENISPLVPHFFCPPNTFMRTQSQMIGSAKSSTFIFSPMSATSHHVTVVPTFAPNMSQSDPAKERIPAFTNPIARRVVA